MKTVSACLLIILVSVTLLSEENGTVDRGNGAGAMRYPDGTEYRGEWKHGDWHGQGTLLKPDGSEYRGGFHSGVPHGKGIYIYGKGRRKRVVFENGNLVSSEWIPIRSIQRDSRFGSFVSNGEYTGWYRGNRIKGYLPHGRGEMDYFNGSRYVGQWRDGKMHGRGVIYWSDGSVYAGEWRHGKRTGYGTYTWPSGSRYVGSWKDNIMDGRGTMYRDTETVSGLWEEGVLVKKIL